MAHSIGGRFDSFDKDIPAIAAAYNASFLDGVIAFNEQMKAQETK